MSSQHSTQPLDYGDGPLNPLQLNRLNQVIQGFSTQQLNWASGYLAGQGSLQASAPVANTPTLTVLYASQTGNAKLVAEKLAAQLGNKGLLHRVVSTADFKPRDLSKEQWLVLVISTQGEGEAPESAHELQRYLFSARAPQLSQLRFAVFGLGDSSYEFFCQAAKDFDKRLEALGAQRLFERVDADVDFLTSAESWTPQLVDNLAELAPQASTNVVPLSTAAAPQAFDRSNPYPATLLENRRITTDKALADVRHIVLGIDPEQLHYSPGDSVGIWFKNDPALVDEVLRSLHLDGHTEITLQQQTLSLRDALIEKLEITQLHPKVIKAWAEHSDASALQPLSEKREDLLAYAKRHQLLDLLAAYPAAIEAQAFVALLQPLQPRLYSIASSQREYEDEIHLTVALLQYQAHGRDHQGGASSYLSQRLNEGEVLDIYIAENPQFRLPQDPQRQTILIAAGTGIAPFRAFLQQRQAEQASGENWLLFGNRHFQRDFLYQSEWQALRAAGVLQQVTPAFSRDSHRPAYVQDRLLEHAEAVFQKLQQGAYLYVCGSTAMEEGVKSALLQIIQRHAQLSESEALDYIENLRSEGRYQRDVY